MRMLDRSGRRWTRRVRANVKPLSRDGARVAFKELEGIAQVDHVEGRGWYGLRRIAADLAESATTDDRVKDRLGGWQASENTEADLSGSGDRRAPHRGSESPSRTPARP